ncbi:hypothetical protein CDO44_20170 [Pigmentiphaga sp. NML080357]|nr:hypothetical protein CDO44_20170 [Pigmentiphaga sp. NML080357]
MADEHRPGLDVADRPVSFDIGRQPLRQALEQYFRTTGQSLLYDDAITAGKQAGPLKGEFTPDAALRTLLAGTGIIARQTAPNAFMLLDAHRAAGARETAAAPAGGSQATTAVSAYYAALQAAVGSVLCGDPSTAPGGYRLAARVWIGMDGAVQRVLLHTTGDAARDRRIEARLQGLQMPPHAPAGITQPLTLLVLPRPPEQGGDCAVAAA